MNVYDVDPDDLIGAVKFNNRWRFYAGLVGEWILDYYLYDPEYKFDDLEDGSPVFRNNLFFVDEHNADEFCKAMNPYLLSTEEVYELLKKRGAANFPLYVVVNFDEQIYVNGYSELPMHEYVPATWKSVEDSPYKYVPADIAHLWISSNSVE